MSTIEACDVVDLLSKRNKLWKRFQIFIYTVLSSLQSTMLSPTVLKVSPTVLKVSPTVLNTLHSTDVISCMYWCYPPMYWIPSTTEAIPHCTDVIHTVLKVSPTVLNTPTVLMLSPTVLMLSLACTDVIPQCAEQSPLYWATSTVLNHCYMGWFGSKTGRLESSASTRNCFHTSVFFSVDVKGVICPLWTSLTSHRRLLFS